MLQKVSSSPTIQHVPLAKLVLDVTTRNPSAKPDETFTYIDLSAVDQEQKAITGARTLAGDKAPSRARQVICADDVLVSTVRPNLNGIALVPEDHDGAIASTGFCVLRPDKKLLDPVFLFHWVQSPAFITEMVRKATGASYPAVSDRIVQQSLIPLTSLPEQRRIAAILDQADALRAKRREALAKLDEMAQAIFVEMFGDPLNDKHAPNLKEVNFEDVSSRITYGFTSPMSHHEAGIPIITAKNVLEGRIDFGRVHYANKSEFDALTDKSKPKAGDILITKDGTIGRCAVFEGGTHICINQSVALVQLDRKKVQSSYVVSYLMTPSVQAKMKGMKKGNALQHLQITELAKFPMPLPSYEKQTEFDRRRSFIGEERLRIVEAADALDTLFTSLQHRAFAGTL